MACAAYNMVFLLSTRQPLATSSCNQPVQVMIQQEQTHCAAAAVLLLQLSERYAGNKAYKQRDYTTAMHHYERALAVVNFVVGSNADDQAEVQHNKATVLLNMAAVHMALQVTGLYCLSADFYAV